MYILKFSYKDCYFSFFLFLYLIINKLCMDHGQKDWFKDPFFTSKYIWHGTTKLSDEK